MDCFHCVFSLCSCSIFQHLPLNSLYFKLLFKEGLLPLNLVIIFLAWGLLKYRFWTFYINYKDDSPHLINVLFLTHHPVGFHRLINLQKILQKSITHLFFITQQLKSYSRRNALNEILCSVMSQCMSNSVTTTIIPV